MASSDKELAEQLMEAGNALFDPPSSVEELLPLLDQVENYLARVEQSPKQSMQSALSSSQKALITDPLFRHSDVDVKAAVAACISEITRITAPEAPYDDEKMKEVFQLIVSSFENLFDMSSRSYSKRTSILETVAKVRSCVVMLDLECDALIVEMFQHFLKTIRDYHPENVFCCMETIMTLVVEESEDISPELLAPLLESLKRDNEEVLPVSRKLAEKVLESCAAKLKPYLTQALEKLGSSITDYTTAVSSVCQESSDVDEQKDVTTNEPMAVDGKPAEEPLDEEVQAEDAKPAEEAVIEKVQADDAKPAEEAVDEKVQADDDKPAEEAVDEKVQADDDKPAEEAVDEKVQADDDKPAEEVVDEKVQEIKEIPQEVVPAEQNDLADEKSTKSAVSNGIPQPKEDETLNSLDKQDEGKPADQPKDTDTSVTTESKALDTENLANEDSQAEKNTEKSGETISPSKLTEPSDGPREEKEDEAIPEQKSDDKDTSDAAEEEKPVDAAVSSGNKMETVSQPSSPKATNQEPAELASPTASGNAPDESLPKKMGRSKRKRNLAKDATPSAADASKKMSEETSDAEAKPNKRSAKKVPTGNSNGEKTKNESGTASDSEAKPVKQAVKKADVSSNNAVGSSSKKQDKKKSSRGKGASEKEETKTSTKNVEKEKVAARKSLKPQKDESDVETPKTNAKRKVTPGKEKGSGSKVYGENVVGSKIKVWWPEDETFYKGYIHSYDRSEKRHKVLYDDGEEEDLILKKETWEFVASDSESDEEEAGQASPGSSDDLPPKKKTKTSEQSTKQSKTDISPKTGSSSKSKGAATKSARKSKDDVKVDSKAAAKDNTTTTTTTPKSGKSKEDSLSKLKEDSKASKSKQETPKASSSSSTAKVKPPKSSSSDGKSNGTGKTNKTPGGSSSSKAKESEAAPPSKSSTSSSSKAASGSKSGKKRRR